MYIDTIYSWKRENVILDTGVNFPTDYIDTKTNEAQRLLDLLKNDPTLVNTKAIKAAQLDLPEIKRYVEWADAQLDASEESFIEEHHTDHEEVCECGQLWWDEMSGGRSSEWPTLEKYLQPEKGV